MFEMRKEKPIVCYGCDSATATHIDKDGVPLCDSCFKATYDFQDNQDNRHYA